MTRFLKTLSIRQGLRGLNQALSHVHSSLSLVLSIALSFWVSNAWAATDVNWGGGSGGTVDEPLDVADLANWSGVSALSDAYNLTFDAGNKPTVLTNSCADAAATKIANNFNLKYGTWTLLGDYKFSSIDAKNSGTDPKVTTIVKKGDWELTYAAYLGRSGATTIITNVAGKVEQSGTSWFQIGNGNGGTAIIENLSGDWIIKGALVLGHGEGSRGELYWRGGNLMQNYTSQPFSFGYGNNTSAVVEKYAGDWTTTDYMIIARGQNSIARFKHDGGNMTVDGDFYCSYASNSVATVEKNGGDWTLGKSLYLGWGGKNVNSSALTTFYHNGGKMNVASNLDITYYGSCDFHMNGGEITVGNQVRFGTWYLKNGWHHGTVNLNGGILSAKGFYLNNSDNKKLSKVVFDGGTFKATASGYIVSGALARYEITNDTMLDALRARVGIDVGPKGGTIDTAGYDITNVVNITRTSGSGGMRFVGGGSVVLTGTIGYTGKTFVEVGTRLELTDSSAKNAILNTYGLDIVGFAASGDYTVFTYEGGLDAEADLEKVTCSFAPDSTFEVVGNSIVCHYVKPVGNFWTGAKDNNLSDAANWSDGVVPIDNAFLSLVKPAVLTVGDTFAPATLTIDGGSAVVTIGAGDLHISGSLTNANKLAIAQGASLTVDGELVQTDAAFEPICLLYSNEGTVSVGGKVRYCARNNSPSMYQYYTATVKTKPIHAKGLAYDCGGSGRLYAFLYSYSGDMNGRWVIGSDGISFPSARQASYSRFYTQSSAPVTFGSSADWTLANSGKNSSSGGDLFAQSGASIALDTSDVDDSSVGRTITLNGRVLIAANAANPGLIVKGCGTVIVNTTGSHSSLTEEQKNTCINTALAVTDTAILKVNAGKKILGSGTISLSSGTTLALESTSREFATPDIVPVTLPAEGAAAIRIDGKRLASGEHVLCALASAPENLDDRVTVTGEAIDGRRCNVKAVEVTENSKTVTKLVLNIYPAGMMIIIR